MNFVKGKFRCYVGHTAKDYIAGDRQGTFPKEVTIKSKSEGLASPGQGNVQAQEELEAGENMEY